MELVLFIFASSFPLIIATIAALSSEYAGRMIFFIDGLITLSAFICFAVTVKFNNFSSDEKHYIVNILNDTVIINQTRQTVLNAVKLYCRSVFDALNEGDLSLIQFYSL